MEERVGQMEARGPRPRGRAAPPADDVRPRDDARARLLLRRRELLAPPRAARAGHAAVDAARLLPARLAAGRRRVAHDDPAGRRHVQERPDPQGDPRRLRVPAALGARQPAAHVRGVRGERQPGDLHERDARAVRARAQRAHRRAAHPADRDRRPADHGPPDRRPDRRPARGDPRARRARRARPRHDADQEDGRGPRGLPPRARGQGPVPPLARSTRSSGSRSCATSGWASSTSSSGSTCCARGSTCPRSRSSRSSTPTRRGSCGRPGRSSR